MSHFELISIDRPTYHYVGDNVAAVLEASKRYSLEEADIYRDSKYLFTLQMNGADHGFWIIHVKREISHIISRSDGAVEASSSCAA
jgi:hypothetical protein